MDAVLLTPARVSTTNLLEINVTNYKPEVGRSPFTC